MKKPDSPLLEMKNLKKSFDDQEVLKGVNFSVQQKEAVTIIGPSGSGKSTLIRCLNLLEEFEAEYIFEGRRVEPKKMDRHRFRQNFGMVFQNFHLFPHRTVLENIVEGPTQVQLRNKEVVIAEAETLLEQVGILEKRNQYPQSLSGGQKQRVAIARALAMKPKALLFDEPTSALDPEMVGEVLEVIKNVKNQETTMVLVTHEMEFAKNVSDRLLFLAKGEIVEEGPARTLFEAPKTDRLKEFLERV